MLAASITLVNTSTTEAQNINVTSGTSVITGDAYPGIITSFKASGDGTLLDGANITIGGEVVSSNTATLRLTESSVSRNSVAIAASRGGTLDLTDVTITAGTSPTTAYVSGIRVETGSKLIGDNLNITVTGVADLGEQRAGIDILGKSQASVINSTVSVTGNYIHGFFNSGGATSTIEDSTISTNGLEATGIYSYGANGGSTLTARNLSITTAGSQGYGVYAAAAGGGSGSNGTGKVFGEKINVTTTGNSAWGIYARYGGEIEITGGTVNTSGNHAYGVRIAPLTAAGVGNTSVKLTNVDVNTSGTSGHAYFVDQNGTLTVQGGSAKANHASAYGLYIQNASTATFQDTTIESGNTAIRAVAGDPTYDLSSGGIAVINLLGKTTVSSGNGKLLEVVRTGTGTSSHSSGVELNIGNGAHAIGDIFDNGTKTTGYLDIQIATGGTLTANVIEGFRNIDVNGSLLGSGTLTLGNATSLTGDGIVGHNVHVDGGTLSSNLIIRGQLTLSAGQQVDMGDISGNYEVEAGTQANITNVEAGATVDASAGTAVIETLEEGATLIAGNWGATVTNLDGATVDGGDGTIRATNVTGGNIVAGTLNVNNSGEAPDGPAGSLTLGANASLSGNGIINADTTIQGGQLNPGNSPGTLTFVSNLTLDGDTVTTFELGADASDFITVGGTANFGGTLSLVLASDFTPSLDQTIDLFDFAAASGTFSNIIINRDDYVASFNSTTGEVTFEVVPEPGTYLFILSGAAATWWMNRRRKKAA